jgi:transcription initiation factor TFIIIB Brf1 subunit/transcription initiation factor TFIIB
MLSKFIANKIEKNDLITDNIPHAIAAGIIYFIAYNCQLNISKQDIKMICGVSEVTINKCFKKLEMNKDNFLPKAIIDKYSM